MSKISLEEFREKQIQKNETFFNTRQDLSHLELVDRKNYGEDVFQTDQLKDKSHKDEIFEQMSHLRKRHRIQNDVVDLNTPDVFPCGEPHLDPCHSYNSKDSEEESDDNSSDDQN